MAVLLLYSVMPNSVPDAVLTFTAVTAPDAAETVTKLLGVAEPRVAVIVPEIVRALWFDAKVTGMDDAIVVWPSATALPPTWVILIAQVPI